MAGGVRARLRKLESRWSEDRRYIDAAMRLVVCRRSDDPDDDTGTPTGQTSGIIGGVWDCHLRKFVPNRKPNRIVEARVSLPQFGYAIDTTPRLMGKGGRGGGKSEALAEKCRFTILSNPAVRHILVLSPDYPRTKLMWRKVYLRLRHWIRDVRVADRELHTVFGCIIKFMSAHLADSVRGFDAAVGLLDEEKDISAEAYDNFLLCIRLGGRNPHIAGVGTPEAGGEYEERWNSFAKDPDAAQHSFPSLSNPFISPRIFEIAERTMDRNRYRQEVLAEFVPMNQDEFVFRAEFDRAKHSVKSPLQWVDITRRVTKNRTGKAFRYVAGIDYNQDYPCVAHIYRIYSPGETGGRNRWVLHKIIKHSGHAGWLAQAMIDSGFTGANTLVIDDASSEYNAPGGKKDPNTAARLMRHRGFTLIHPKKNPPVRDRVAAYLSKINPVSGDNSWFYDTGDAFVAETVERTAMMLKWRPGGRELDKEDGVDHDFDAMTYPVAHFEPAAAIAIPRVTGWN